MSSALREAIQALRQVLDDEDAGNDRVLDCAIEVVADHPGAGSLQADFRYAFVEGIEAAREQGIEYSNRDRRLIGEVLAAYGRASGALEKPGFGRCELSHTFAEVCRFTFQPKPAEPS